MIGILCFLLLFVACSQGTECDVLDGTTLKCIFPNNVNSTRTDFTAYFYPSDNGYPELLIDCGWVDDSVECIQQEGFSRMRPVSNIAEIRLHTRFAVKTGKYKCIAEGVSVEDAKPCQYTNSQPEAKQRAYVKKNKTTNVNGLEKPSTHLVQIADLKKHSPNNHPDNEDKGLPPSVIGLVSGAAVVFVLAAFGFLCYNRLNIRSKCLFFVPLPRHDSYAANYI